MKKYTLALVLMACLPVMAANGYEYASTTSESYTNMRPVKASAYKKTVTSRKTGGYHNTITNNFYYAQPAQPNYYEPRRAAKKVVYEDDYEEEYVAPKKKVTKAKKSRPSTERKYFLAHPFFQPLKGGVGSVTDFAYTQNNFKFDIPMDGWVYGLNPDHPGVYCEGIYGDILNGKQESTQFLVKEDVSIGLSDTLALVAMAQYDKTKVSFKDWSDGSAGTSMTDSGLNIFGIGVQDRFLDNDEWIGMIAGSFLHQKDTANIFLGEFKAGYKINRTTVYGLANIRYIDITKGDTYGAFAKEKNGDYLMLTYNTDISGLFEIEGGVGVFSALNKYFTLNGEVIYGHYDWHDQINLRGAIGVQPADMFALNLYASVNVYDSADNKTEKYIYYKNNVGPADIPVGYPYNDSTALSVIGNYKIKNYNEWKVGLQAILYF